MRKLKEVLAKQNSAEKKMVNMYSSLLSAVEEAGGDPFSFVVDRLEKMTATELIESLGPNDIVFKFERPE